MNKIFLLIFILGTGFFAHSQTTTTPPAVVVAPTPPTMETCASGDFACSTRNQVAQQQYQNSLINYQTLQQQSAAAAQEQLRQAQLAAQAAAAQEAALAAAKRAERENKKSSSAYGTSQIINTAIAMALTAVCSTGPPGSWACAPAMFFAMQAGKAGSQKASNNASQFNACNVANQISTSPGSCGAAPTPYNPGGFPANSTTPLTDMFDPGGNCIGTQAQCQAVLDNLPPGTNIRNAMDGISQFASGKGPFSVNPDGSIKNKNGKTFGLGAFDSKKSMMDAGMTSAQADQMLAMMAKQKAMGDLDAKAALAKESGFGQGGDGMAGGAGAGKAGDGSANGDADGGLGKNTAGSDRGLASEGLTKDFNGEQIGAKGDDIFKMMNRRYRLKASQDAFIATPP